MKRCVICDSTDVYDTLADLGFNNPITHWHIDKRNGDYICNRCDTAIVKESQWKFNNVEVEADDLDALDEFTNEDDDQFIDSLHIKNGVDFDEEWESNS
jgi:hypothetical protein